MATDERNDPFRGFNFRVEIDGVPSGASARSAASRPKATRSTTAKGRTCS